MIPYKKCLPTIYQMLEDRGYTNIQTNHETMKTTADKDGEKIYVYFATSKKKGLGVNEVRNILEEVAGEKLILVYESSITFYAKQAIKEYPNVETFQAKRLYYNVTQHVLVPPHRLLTEEQKEEFLLKHNVKLNQCKRILCTDPVAKYYGAVPGNLMEIERSSPDGRRFYAYRVVV